MRKALLAACALSGVALISVACGSTTGSSFGDGSDGGSGGGAGSDDSGGGGGGSNGEGGFGGGATDSGGGGNGGDAGLNECAADTQQAKLAPLDLVLMQDTSGSMWETTSGSTTKYDAVKTALDAFMGDTGSAGIGLGLQYFPLFKNGLPNSCASNAECGTGGGSCILGTCSTNGNTCGQSSDCGGGTCKPNIKRCNGDPEIFCVSTSDCTYYGLSGGCSYPEVRGQCYNDYFASSNPLSCTSSDYSALAVPVAALPGAKTALDTSLGQHIPNGNTPTYNALDGAIQAAKAYATAHSDHIVAVVLSTDGIPNTNGACDHTNTEINALAAAALAGTPSVKTFVIGVLSPSDDTTTATSTLNGIAAAGGTTAATIIGTSATTTTDFVAALTKIRGQSLPCELALPVPDAGTPDYSKVNVVYTESKSGNADLVPYVADTSGCTADAGASGGWYYDVDPFLDAGGVPTKVELCPATCAAVQADPAGKVNVVQGCKTTTTGGGPPR